MEPHCIPLDKYIYDTSLESDTTQPWEIMPKCTSYGSIPRLFVEGHKMVEIFSLPNRYGAEGGVHFPSVRFVVDRQVPVLPQKSHMMSGQLISSTPQYHQDAHDEFHPPFPPSRHIGHGGNSVIASSNAFGERRFSERSLSLYTSRDITYRPQNPRGNNIKDIIASGDV